MARVQSVGAVSSLGGDWPTCWRALLNAEHNEQHFPVSEFHVPLNAPIAAVPGLMRSIDQSSPSIGAGARLIRLVAHESLAAAGQSAARVTVYGGSTHGESDVMLTLAGSDLELRGDNARLWQSLLLDPMPRALPEQTSDDAVAATWIYAACVSGAISLTAALADLVDDPRGPLRLVIAVDALSALGVAGFVRCGASTRDRCRPFRANAAGTLVAEGAAALLLGPADGTGVEILSVGLSCDAAHQTRPDPTGAGVKRALNQSLALADLSPSDVTAVILHGSGTPASDPAEVAAMLAVFGAKQTPCVEVKSALGHTMGAAGMFNCLVAIEACRARLLPPSAADGIMLNDALDLVRDAPREIGPCSTIIAMCSGFGGNHAAVVFRSRE